MVKKESPLVFCSRCGYSFRRDDACRECSNCFACTGCEIFICPACGAEVVIRPKGEPRKRRTAGEESNPGEGTSTEQF